MTDDVQRYRQRREMRLKREQPVDAVQRFRERRYNRLVARMDADDDEKNGNKNSGGGHGNTRIPFGLCEREGIKVGDNWTPKDAWKALEGKGYSPDGVYKELQKTGSVSEARPAKVEAPKMSPKEANKAIKGFQETRKKRASLRWLVKHYGKQLADEEIWTERRRKIVENAIQKRDHTGLVYGTDSEAYKRDSQTCEEAIKRFEAHKSARDEFRDKLSSAKRDLDAIENSEEKKRYVDAVKTKWPTFGECKTVKELKERFDTEDYFTDDQSSFGRLDIESAVAIAEDVEAFFRANPKMRGKLGHFEVKKLYYGGLSYDDYVEFDSTEFKSRVREEKRGGYLHSEHVRDWGRQTVFHEYSHQMDTYISKKLGMSDMGFSTYVYNETVKRLKEAGSPIVSGLEEKIPSKIKGEEERKEFLDGLIKERVKRAVSEYAYKGGRGVHKNDVEFFAEAMSNLQTDSGPGEVEKIVGKIFEEKLKELRD